MKNLYTYKNYTILKNGSAVKTNNLQKVKDLKVFYDNYNIKYLSKVQRKEDQISSGIVLKKLLVASFFDKYKV